jgi:hypothetical protein
MVSGEVKLYISVSSEGVQVTANRKGLVSLAKTCIDLANLPESREESRQLGNHYHYAEYMNNVEPGSVPMEILYDTEL